MPAKTEKQRRFFGAVTAYKEGKLKNPSKKLKKVARGVSMSDAKDFSGSLVKQRHALADSMMKGR